MPNEHIKIANKAALQAAIKASQDNIDGTTIWVYAGIRRKEDPALEAHFKAQVYKSLYEEGMSRFGWHGDGKSLDEAGSSASQNAPFLWEIKEGHWVVHVNLPKHDGSCVAARVLKPYDFKPKPEELKNDFGGVIAIDKETLIAFNRYDHSLTPRVKKRLTPRGRYQRLYSKQEFFESLQRLSEVVRS